MKHLLNNSFKIVVIGVVCALLFPIAHVFAAGEVGEAYQFLAPLPTETGATLPAENGLSVYANSMYRILVSISGVIAVFMLVYGGILYMSSDAITGKREGKDIIKRTLWGLILVIGSWLIIYTLNPSSLNPDTVSKGAESVGRQVPGVPRPKLNPRTPASYELPKYNPEDAGIYVPGDSSGGPLGLPGGSTGVYNPNTGGGGTIPGGTQPGPSYTPPPVQPEPAYSNNFTQVTPSPTSKKVYVSTSGNDSNPGTEAAPISSINKALTKNPDFIYLKRGDTWTSGFDLTGRNGVKVLAYGSGPRPKISIPGQGTGIRICSNTGNILIQSIHLHTTTSNNQGIAMEGCQGVHDVTIEDAYIEGFRMGITLNMTTNDGSVINNKNRNFKLRRSVITNSHSKTGGDSSGLYIDQTDGILLEDNVFFSNGRRLDGGGETTRNHNAYIHALNWNVTVRNNIFAFASSHGLQARAGGVVENNLFYDNAIHLSFGLVNGSGTGHPNGVVGRITNNVMVGAKNIGSEPRGFGIIFGNIKPGGNTVASGNIIANNRTGSNFPAIQLESGVGDYAHLAVGIHDLTLKDNIVFNWSKALLVEGSITPGGTGKESSSNIIVTQNSFPTGIVDARNVLTVSSPITGVTYPHPEYANDGYLSLIQEAMKNDINNWRPNYTAKQVINRVREGFGKPAI
ncbi:MAG: pilin [Patescibacteria group bacterium]